MGGEDNARECVGCGVNENVEVDIWSNTAGYMIMKERWALLGR